MGFNLLCLDDFVGMDFGSNISMVDMLLQVCRVRELKNLYEEEDNLVAEQDKEFCIKKQEKTDQNIRTVLSSFPVHQPRQVLDFTAVPRGQRSVLTFRPRKVTEKFICHEDLIKVKPDHSAARAIGQVTPHAPDHRAARVIGQVFACWGAQGMADHRGARAIADQPLKPKRKFIGSGNLIKKAVDNYEEKQNMVKLVHTGNEEEEESVKKKVKRAITFHGERELPSEFMNIVTDMGGSLESVRLVIEKKLFITDVRPGEGRLSIPVKQVRNKFLKPEEIAHLDTRDENDKMCQMKVKLIEPSLRRCEINLRKWIMRKRGKDDDQKDDDRKTSSSYVLVTFWNDVVRRNGLKIDTLVQLWAFRVGSELCFALVKVPD